MKIVACSSISQRGLAVRLCVAGFVGVVCVSGLASPAAATDGIVRLQFDVVRVQRQFASGDFLTALPVPRGLGVERIVAFEDHPDFAYLSGVSGDGAPVEADSPVATVPTHFRQAIFIRPRLLIVDDQVDARCADEIHWTLTAPRLQKTAEQELQGDWNEAHFHCRALLPQTAEWKLNHENAKQVVATQTAASVAGDGRRRVRFLKLISFDQNRESLPTCSVTRQRGAVQLEIAEQDASAAGRVIRLSIPDRPTIGRVEIVDGYGAKALPSRFFPAGIFPPDMDAAQRRLQWDLPYQIEGMATWDIGRPSSELQRQIEGGAIKPGRAVEIGCGTGNDAIYLARRGFDVTAIDISPTALNIAEQKAAKAGVDVKWLLADALQPPPLKAFDFIYDRGCYHEVRQHHAKAYVESVRRLSRAGTKVLILAGNANKDTYWRFEGPPRVRERDIRDDFARGFRLVHLREFRFDPAPPEREGALAWSILLVRHGDTSGNAVQ